jgi:hypothetical protein
MTRKEIFMKKAIVLVMSMILVIGLVFLTSCCFCWQPCGKPSIEVVKYVSVDKGVTWLDANTVAQAPSLRETHFVKYQFVVTNTGNVELTNIMLTDSNHNIMDWGNTIVSPLAPGASFTCTIGYEHPPIQAIVGEVSNTATVTGDYRGLTYGDTDDAWYIGVPYGVTIP